MKEEVLELEKENRVIVIKLKKMLEKLDSGDAKN
jgi:hypothetical protein